MEYEKCYVFEPEDQRPAKKRKVEPQGLHKSWNHRQELYQKAWQFTKRKIDSNLKLVNKTTVNDIFRFLDGATSRKDIPTAFISTGAEGGSIKRITDDLAKHINTTAHRKLVSLFASDGTNLKALVKSLIRRSISREEGVDEDDEGAESSKTKVNAKLLNYDLQILANHVKSFKIRQIAIIFQETEAFDSELLSDLIELLGNYKDRIPITFVFCLATSVDFLQQRLSRMAAKSLSGQLFDLAPLSTEVEQVFDAITDESAPIWIGPSLISMVFERQEDYIQSIDTLVDEIQYAYMSCFYANALTVFLDKPVKDEDIPKDHYDAVRNLPSFQHWAMHDIRSGDHIQDMRAVLEDNAFLRNIFNTELEAGLEKISNITTAIMMIQKLQNLIPGTQVTPKSKLYMQAMSNKLKHSSLIRSLLLSIRKAPSNVTMEILSTTPKLSLHSPYYLTSFGKLRSELCDLMEAQNAPDKPLRSEEDVRNSTLRTTVVAQKVELSKQKSTLSKEDAAYTTVIRKFTDLLEEYFNEVFIDVKSLLLNEVFIYDLKSPHREVFMPRPRHAIERALAAPHDYLDCDCCAPGKDDGDEQTLSATQPATAVLYQLYLESGTLINASDLWQAFQAVMGDEKSEGQNMALLQRGLAEMKYLGMMKNTRKRVDHVAKVAWKGL